MQNDISSFQLSNGLRVLLKEIHTVPIVSQWTWYRVGSRNEKAGIRGISHWVEHLQFKGTEKFPGEKLDQVISRVGGIWNAMTHLDWTTYYETLPANQIDLALDLEADRMQHSVFDEDEINAERTVVISELEGNENDPLFRLNSAIQSKAFQFHPYSHDVIGTLEDLQHMTRDQLFRYYQDHYNPDNAILCIAGDFNITEVTAKIERYFSSIPPRSISEENIPVEPDQTNENYLEIKGPGDALYIQIAYHASQANHRDFFTLSVLDSLLAGPSPLVMFGGGGISNRTSRLYQALVEKDIVVSVSGDVQATIDPFLHTFILTLNPTADPHKALQAFDKEIEKIKQEKISRQDIDRAIQQAEAMFAYGSENITNQAFWMGYSSIFASYDWYENYIQNLRSITDTDIQTFAQKHFAFHNRTIGIYFPTQEEDHDAIQ
ncbi:MAG TPA: pitrilysin family protein [Anaerolineaceae bacterium]|mgnify:CR=1 FL=1|nr:pitrilysin family protein [Anaerolineaceae bacterium]